MILSPRNHEQCQRLSQGLNQILEHSRCEKLYPGFCERFVRKKVISANLTKRYLSLPELDEVLLGILVEGCSERGLQALGHQYQPGQPHGGHALHRLHFYSITVTVVNSSPDHKDSRACSL
jgi:hypothetical protein